MRRRRAASATAGRPVMSSTSDAIEAAPLTRTRGRRDSDTLEEERGVRARERGGGGEDEPPVDLARLLQHVERAVRVPLLEADGAGRDAAGHDERAEHRLER